MLKRIVKLPNAQAVAASSTATFDLPIGARYHQVQMALGHAGTPNWLTDVTEIRVKVDGRIQRRMTPTQLNEINSRMGAQYALDATNDLLTIFFSEFRMRTVEGTNALAWGTGGISSLQIEVDIGAVTTPTLTGVAVIDDQLASINNTLVPFPLGKIVKWRLINFPAGVAGDNFLQSLPKNPTDDYYGIHGFSSDISRVQIKVDNVVVLDALKIVYDQVLTGFGKAPVAGSYDVMFDMDNEIGSRLPMTKNNGQTLQDFQVIYTMATGNAFAIVTRVLGNID